MLTLKSRREVDFAVLDVSGPVDIYTATQLRLACLGLESSRRACIDLSRVSFMDTVGISVLLGFQRRAQRRGHFVALVDPPGHVYDALKLFGLDDVFSIHPTCAAAAAAVAEG